MFYFQTPQLTYTRADGNSAYLLTSPLVGPQIVESCTSILKSRPIFTRTNRASTPTKTYQPGHSESQEKMVTHILAPVAMLLVAAILY